jgi:flagellar P-ring protein FlgI
MNKRLMIRWLQLFGAMALIYVLLPSLSHAERIKDMASVAGVRTNQVIGYGLVVGLNGTGDQTTQAPFTIQSISNMLANFGLPVPASVASQMQLKNVAAVTVTAELPPFVKAGQTIDITVASIANATSLRGGALLMTPLRGADGEVYAVAQGSVMVSGFGVAGKDGSRVSVNVPSGGRIPNGATVEREVPNTFGSQPFVVLNLNSPDFTNAARLTDMAVHRRSMRCRSRSRRRPMKPRGWRSSASCRKWRSSPAMRPHGSSSIRVPARS